MSDSSDSASSMDSSDNASSASSIESTSEGVNDESTSTATGGDGGNLSTADIPASTIQNVPIGLVVCILILLIFCAIAGLQAPPFSNGGKFMSDKNLVFMSSADLMPRNLLRRVETFIPLENKTVREQALKQVMYASFTDRENKWFLEKDGKYFKYFGDQTNFSSHSYFMKNPSLSGQGSLSDVYKKSNNTLLKNQKK